MKLLLLLVTLGLPGWGWGQQIARQDVLADLRFLHQAVQQGHPANYDPANYHTDLDPVLTQVEALRSDSLSAHDYRLLLAEALYRVGCVHTSVYRNPLATAQARHFFPLRLVMLNERLYVGPDSTYQLAGAEVQALNGVPATTLTAAIRHYWASDGGGTALAEAAFNKLSAALISQYVNYPAHYIVATTGGRSVAVPAATTLPKAVPPTWPADARLRSNDNSLQLRPEAAVLRVRSFALSDVAFFHQALAYVQQQQLPTLIIDLRGNTGGNRAAAVALARHLIATPFSYTIVQPRRLHLFRYANATGKLYLGLAGLKYQVGSFWRGQRTPLGRAFTYHYRPQPQPYQGRLFVLTDGLTASSATMLTSWLRQHTRATFVGQPAGGGYNGNNGGAFPRLTLPKSRIELTFPAYRLVLDLTSRQRTGIVPDIVSPRRIEQVLQQHDPDLETVLTLLRQQAK